MKLSVAVCKQLCAALPPVGTAFNGNKLPQPTDTAQASERATAAAGTSSCKLFKSRLDSHQLPMILLTIGTLVQACTVSSCMLIHWRLNLVKPEINPRQTRTDNNARPPHIKIRFLPDRKHNDTSTTNTWKLLSQKFSDYVSASLSTKRHKTK